MPQWEYLQIAVGPRTWSEDDVVEGSVTEFQWDGLDPLGDVPDEDRASEEKRLAEHRAQENDEMTFEWQDGAGTGGAVGGFVEFPKVPNMSRALNDIGAMGWELVSALPAAEGVTTMLFKRERQVPVTLARVKVPGWMTSPDYDDPESPSDRRPARPIRERSRKPGQRWGRWRTVIAE